jgi:TRAP-type C4-dicarboxylate transport system permease small subunit
MPWLTRQSGHVSIDMLVDVFPVTKRKFLIGFGRILAGLTSGFIGCWAILLTIDNFRRGVETNGIYPIPRGWLIGVIALGLILTSTEFFRSGYKTFSASDDVIINRHGEPGAEP